MSWWWVGFYAVTAVAIGAGATWWGWPPEFPTPTDAKDRISAVAEQTKAKTDAIRTGLAAAGGAGAVFTLLLAVRRQRSTEEMDAATRHDAEQRRMTDLYTAAAEQLGHERAAVRLAGLYALQRLGHSYPEQRRPIVNVWCAYLRMPFQDPEDKDVDETERAELRQELEVRVAVQRLLREHVHSGPHDGKPASPRYWGDDLEVDFTGATLYKLDLFACRVHPSTTFREAQFLGYTTFAHAAFNPRTSFNDASFNDDVSFRATSFSDCTWFTNASFSGGRTSFAEASFTGSVSFIGSSFSSTLLFDKAKFSSEARFASASFNGENTSFNGVSFGGNTFFHGVPCRDNISFDGAAAPCNDGHVWPEGWQLKPGAEVSVDDDPPVTWGKLVQVTGAGSDEARGVPNESVGKPAIT